MSVRRPKRLSDTREVAEEMGYFVLMIAIGP